MARISVEVESKGITQTEKELKRLSQQGQKTEKQMDKVGTASAGLGRNMGQAGIQVQQFVGQVQGGQSALLALSQQGADLGIVLGAPLVGVVVSLGAALVGMAVSSSQAEEAQDELEDKMKDVTKEIKTQAEQLGYITQAQKEFLSIVAKGELAGLESELTSVNVKLEQLNVSTRKSGEITEEQNKQFALLRAEQSTLEREIASHKETLDGDNETSETAIERANALYESDKALVSALEDKITALDKSGEQLAVDAALSYLSKDATDEQKDSVEELTRSLYNQIEARKKNAEAAAQRAADDAAAEKEQGSIDKQVESLQKRYDTEFDLLEQRKALVLQSSLSEQEQMALIDQLQDEYFDNVIARVEAEEEATNKLTQNQLDAVNSINAASQALSGSISSGLSSLIDGSKSAKEVALDVVTSVTDSIIKSGVDILVQKFITDNIIKAANLQAVSSQVLQTNALAGQAAFAATSAIPIVGPFLAPAAAISAASAAAAIGAPAIAAAGARMQGGQVTAGVPYQVGERGVETFIPNQSGTITANGAGESTGMTVNVYNQTSSSVQAVENESGGTDIYITRDEFQDGLTAAAQNPNSGLNQGLQSTYKMERN